MAVPLMSLYITPQLALAIQTPVLILIDIANCWKYNKCWSRETVMALVPGALLGLICGAMVFQWIPPDALKAGIGLMALALAARYFLRRSAAAASHWPRPLVFGAGFVSGFAGIIAHAGGPAMKGYLLSRNLKKSALVGTNSVFFLLMNISKGIIYASLGQFSYESAQISLLMLPFLALGVWLGFRLHALISQQTFMRIAYSLLGFAGLRLLWEAGHSMISL